MFILRRLYSFGKRIWTNVYLQYILYHNYCYHYNILHSVPLIYLYDIYKTVTGSQIQCTKQQVAELCRGTDWFWSQCCDNCQLAAVTECEPICMKWMKPYTKWQGFAEPPCCFSLRRLIQKRYRTLQDGNLNAFSSLPQSQSPRQETVLCFSCAFVRVCVASGLIH